MTGRCKEWGKWGAAEGEVAKCRRSGARSGVGERKGGTCGGGSTARKSEASRTAWKDRFPSLPPYPSTNPLFYLPLPTSIPTYLHTYLLFALRMSLSFPPSLLLTLALALTRSLSKLISISKFKSGRPARLLEEERVGHNLPVISSNLQVVITSGFARAASCEKRGLEPQ